MHFFCTASPRYVSMFMQTHSMYVTGSEYTSIHTYQQLGTKSNAVFVIYNNAYLTEICYFRHDHIIMS